MSPRAFACPKCKKKLSAPEGAARFRCPHCKAVLAAPASRPSHPTPTARPAEPSAEPVPPAQAAAPAQAAQPPAAEKLTEAPDPLVGTELGGYEITRRVGRGGMGTVYEAIQAGLKRRVALKVLPPQVATDPDFLASFKREAQAAARLNHPNIVQIFDIVEDQGRHFFSMELVDGDSLAHRLEREGPLPVPDALGIVAQVAAALDYAYEHMLTHRDIKPSNILLTQRGDVKIADLGLSKSLEETSVGIARSTHGGPVYMAPELAQNPQLADCRSDIYALGAVLFHMLTGRPPFPGPSIDDLVRQHAAAPFPSARELVPQVPQAVDALLQKMCAKDPEDRFQTHGELLEQLELLLKRTTIRMPKVIQPQPAFTRKRGRRWILWAALAAGAAAMAIAGLLLVPPLLDSEPQEKAARAEDQDGEAQEDQDEQEKQRPETPRAEPAKEPQDQPPPIPEIPEPGHTEPPQEKTEEPEEPKEQPEQPQEPPEWQAALDEARQQAKLLAEQDKLRGAAEVFDSLVQDHPDNAALKEAARQAAQPYRQKAAAAFDQARRQATALAQEGKPDEARQKLRDAVRRYATPHEAEAAEQLLQTFADHEKSLQKLRQATQRAAHEAQAAGRRVQALQDFAQALQPAERLLAEWKLDQAAAALGKIETDHEVAARILAERQAQVEALRDLRARLVEFVKTAKPPLTKRQLRITGHNGELVDADENAITIKTPIATETVPWKQLSDRSLKEMVDRLPRKADTDAQALEVALAPRTAKDEPTEDPQVAEALSKAQREAKAAQAFADALQLLAAGQVEKGKDALAAYREDFEGTDHVAAHQELVQTAMAFEPLTVPAGPKEREEKPQPKKPKEEKPKKKKPPKQPPDPEALARYRQAAEAFARRRFEECAQHLDELEKKFPESPLLGDKERKPSVPQMRHAVAAHDQVIRVSRGGGGDARSVAAAFAALEKPHAIIELGPGVYRGGVDIAGRTALGLTLRAAGQGRPVLDGGSARDTRVLLNFVADCKNVWIEGLELRRADTGIFVGVRSSATIRDCVALVGLRDGLRKEPTADIDVAASLFKIHGLSKTQARASAFACAEEAVIESNTFQGCILAGSDLSLRATTLADCLLLGSATLYDNTKLSHVTVVGPLRVPAGVGRVRITDSILESLHVEAPELEEDEKPKVAVTLDHVVLYRQGSQFPKGVVESRAAEALRRAPFASAGGGNYRLAQDSPLRERASDGKSALGCRFPEGMPELPALLKQYGALFRPAAARAR